VSFIRHRRATSPNKFECRNYDSKKNFFDTSAVEAVIKLVIEYNPEAMASIGYFCISEERRSIQNGVRRRLKVSYAILFFVWLFLAVYRYVGYESGIIIGGNDAPTYIDYFQTCLAGKGNGGILFPDMRPVEKCVILQSG
jgi:hypothetical protein